MTLLCNHFKSTPDDAVLVLTGLHKAVEGVLNYVFFKIGRGLLDVGETICGDRHLSADTVMKILSIDDISVSRQEPANFEHDGCSAETLTHFDPEGGPNRFNIPHLSVGEAGRKIQPAGTIDDDGSQLGAEAWDIMDGLLGLLVYPKASLARGRRVGTIRLALNHY